MQHTENKFVTRWIWFFIIVVCGINFLLSGLFRPVLPVDETRYLTVAWEMWVHHDFIVPHLNGLPYSHKPPLLFWLINFFWGLFGVSAFAARLVISIFSFGSVILTYVLARLIWPASQQRQIALMSAIVLSTLFAFMTFSTLIMFDVLLTFWVLLGQIAVVKNLYAQRFKWWWVYGLSLGFALLTKGPVAFLYFIFIPLLAPLWWRAPCNWRRWYSGLSVGIVIGAIMILSWAIPAAYLGGAQYTQEIFLAQTANRMVHSFAHAKPVWFYFMFLPVLFFPWIWWPSFWKKLITGRRELFSDWGMRYCIVSFVFIFFVFSLISGKQFHYLIPIFPVFSLLFACTLNAVNFDKSLNFKWNTRVVLFPAFILIALLSMATYKPLFVLIPGIDNPTLQHKRIFILFQNMSHGYMALIVGALFLVMLVIAWLTKYGNLMRQILLTAIISFLLFLTQFCYLSLFKYTDLTYFAKKIQQYAHQEVAFTQGYRGEFGFLARLSRPVQEISIDDTAAWLAMHPRGIVIAKYHGRPALLNVELVEEVPYRQQHLGIMVSPVYAKDLKYSNERALDQ